MNLVKKECKKNDSSIQIIELGETFTVVGTDAGQIYSWGSNDYYQLGRNVLSEDFKDSKIGLVELPIENTNPQKIIGFFFFF